MKDLIPFGNEKDLKVWQRDNCDKCKKYNCEALYIEDTCSMSYYLDLVTLTGTIPSKEAAKIGYVSIGDSKRIVLSKECDRLETSKTK